MGGRRKPKVAGKPLPPATRAWTARERAIVALHQHYLTQVWSLNDWKLYTQYKKHLAPEYRSEVDRLCDFIVHGQPEPFRVLHEKILATIWDKADWLAVFDDPKVGALDFDDPAAREAWQARLARVRDAE